MARRLSWTDEKEGEYLTEISKEDELEIVRLYDIEKYTLRRIAKIFDTDHHKISRVLTKHNVEISSDDRVITPRKGYKKKPFTEEHRKNIGLASKGRKTNLGKKMSKSSLYKNMQKHLKYHVELEFLQQFDDIDKLKMLNRIIRNSRLPEKFSHDDYKNYIKKFYYDKKFNRTYQNWIDEGKKLYAKPSIDHIIPVSKGGTWELENLQIIPWCINRAKYNFMPEEWDYIRNKYLSKEGEFNY